MKKINAKNLLPFMLAVIFIGGGLSANAATITVNTIADENGTGAACSLREAVTAANTNAVFGGCPAGAGADVINFDAVLFAAPQTITLTVQEILVNMSSVITINGTGANMLTIQNSVPPSQTSSTFSILGDASLTISGVRLTGANLTGVGGGGAFFLNSNGTLNATGVHITGNTVNGYGAAILIQSTTGMVNINNSTISNNTANGSTLGGGGGAIDNSGTLSITNSTISGNIKNNDTNNGGGIYNFSGTTTITNSTITNNTAAGAGSAGGVFRFGGTVIVRNTIIAANVTTPNVAGAFTSQGYNLIGNLGTATGFTGTADQTGVSNANAGLAPLANNGGPTPTHALQLTSFALDKGTNFGSTTDQRGLARTFDNPSIPNAAGGNGTDIGAYERQAATAARVSVSGRVLDENGSGISRAIVYMTDQNGITRTTRTNSFGNYSFSDVEIGQTYIFNVFTKQYQFDPIVKTVDDAVLDLDFTPQTGESGKY